MNAKNNKKVFVALSGGVDSSVAAALIKEKGYDVVGVTMCFNISMSDTKKPSCCGASGIEDAKRVAQSLDIPHYVLNFAEVIDEKIIGNFISEYMNGRTPNPCVQCNQYLKFGALYEKVKSLGADYLATGHYSKVQHNDEKNVFELKKGKDTSKDQSYFLYSIKRDLLPFILFPLGDLTKDEVRSLAEKFNLPTAQKPGSQDICFVPDSGYQKFLEDRVGKDVMVSGQFKDENDNVVGQHKGIAYYTIGQRDKLGIALGRPVYINRIDKETNTIYVADEDKLYSKEFTASQVNFLSIEGLVKDLKVRVKIRYYNHDVAAKVTSLDEDRIKIVFDEPQKSVTPGQSVVLYQGDVILGGGIIDNLG